MASPLIAETPTTPPSESSGSIKKDINHILSMLESPVAGTTPENKDDLPAAQLIDQHFLKDVIAYVEVRSYHENRSSTFIRELTQLGAQVVPKFTNEVTHVIYKDGTKATRDRAKKKGVHLVSVLWVDSCKRNKTHVAENLYPPVLPDDNGTPIAFPRLKKTKSMQPKDFDEEVANSAERGKNRRKRQANADKWKIMETPYSPHLPRTVYAGETQPMSPFSLDMSFSPSLTVPDTPPSMRRRLAELRRKTANIGESDLDTTNPSQDTNKAMPLYRRLFEANLSGMMSGPGSPETPVRQVFGSPAVPVRVTRSPKSPATTRSPKSPATTRSPKSPATTRSPKNPTTTRSPKIPTSSSDSDSTFTNKKQKHKLFLTIPAIDPPSALREPTKATKAMQNKSKLFEPSKGRGGRKRGKSSDSTSDGNGKVEKLKTMSDEMPKKRRPGKRVRMTETELVPESSQGSAPMSTPVGILRVKRTTRRQSIASSTPSKALGSVEVDPIPKRTRGRRSMAVSPADGTDCAPSSLKGDTAEENSVPKRRRGKTLKPTNSALTSPKDNIGETVLSDMKGDTPDITTTHRIAPAKDTTNIQRRRSMRFNTSSLSVEARICESNPGKVLLQRLPSSQHTPQVGQHGVCPADFDSTADDSVILGPPKRRILKIVSSARKRKPARYESDSDGTPFGTKSQTVQFHRKVVGSTASPLPCLSHSRKSLEDFHPSQFNILSSKKLSATRKVAVETSEDSESLSAGGIRRKVRKTSTARPGLSSSTSSEEGRSKKSRPKNTIVITSMAGDDKDVVHSVVKQLGGFRIISNVTVSTTHVICGDARRTLNVLYAITHGIWLVSRQWVLESLEAGRWLDEEPFEIHDYFPAAQKSRIERTSNKQETYQPDLFSKCGSIYVAEQTTPPHHHLVALIKQGGGQVTQCSRKAQLCIGTTAHPEQVTVTEQWLLDSITSYRGLPYDNHVIKDSRSTREVSPDF